MHDISDPSIPLYQTGDYSMKNGWLVYGIGADGLESIDEVFDTQALAILRMRELEESRPELWWSILGPKWQEYIDQRGKEEE